MSDQEHNRVESIIWTPERGEREPEMLRLPDNTYTVNTAEYTNAWKKMSSQIEHLLDVKVNAYDPGFNVIDKQDSSRSIHLPTWLADRILNGNVEIVGHPDQLPPVKKSKKKKKGKNK